MLEGHLSIIFHDKRINRLNIEALRMGYEKDFIMLSCGKGANFNFYKGLGRMKIFIYTR